MPLITMALQDCITRPLMGMLKSVGSWWRTALTQASGTAEGRSLDIAREWGHGAVVALLEAPLSRKPWLPQQPAAAAAVAHEGGGEPGAAGEGPQRQEEGEQ